MRCSTKTLICFWLSCVVFVSSAWKNQNSQTQFSNLDKSGVVRHCFHTKQRWVELSDIVFILNRDERSCQTLFFNLNRDERSCQILFSNLNRDERSCQTLFSYLNRDEGSCQTLFFNLNRNERRCQTLFFNLNRDERSCQTLFSNSNRDERSTYQAGRRRREAGSGVAAARARRRERRGGRRRGRCTWESGRGTGGSDDSLPARCSTGSCSLESEERKMTSWKLSDVELIIVSDGVNLNKSRFGCLLS